MKNYFYWLIVLNDKNIFLIIKHESINTNSKYSTKRTNNLNRMIKESLISKLFLIIIISILFCWFSLRRIKKFVKSKNYYSNYLNQNYDSIDVAFNKSLNFIKSCLSSELIKFPSYYNFDNPKISVIIPLFNCEKYILRAIRSIQLQNISNFEIILIDDDSKDNTTFLIEKIMNEDNRIKLIKNKNNMGVLYSRSIGILSSKGKYLYTLDNDDMFLNEDVIDTITNISENGNFDIVEFKALSNTILNQDLLNNRIKDSIFSHQKSFLFFQPELGSYPISTGNQTGKYRLNDIFLWGKCIKSNIYKNVLYKFGYYRYSRFMIRYEDILTNYMICNIAESFLFVPKYGIYHINRKGSGASIGRKKVSRTNNILYLIDTVIDFSLNNIKNKKLPAFLMIYFLKQRTFKNIITKNKNNKKIFISCMRRILNSVYIPQNHKEEIQRLIKKHKFIRSFNF